MTFAFPPSPALSHIAQGLLQRLGFHAEPQPELASLQAAFGHVFWRTHPVPSQVALEVIVLCDRGSRPAADAWQHARAHFLDVGAACDRLAPPGTFGLVDRYRRITVVEIGHGPQSAEEQARLVALRSGVMGSTMIASAYVDAASGTVWSGAGLGTDLANTVMLHAESPADWIRAILAVPCASGFASPMPPRDTGPDAGPALFSANAVGLAAFLASPLAGGLLVAWNFQRSKRAAAAALTAMFSFAFMTLFMLFAMYTDLPGAVYTGISIGSMVGLRALATKFFPSPQKNASPWLAVLISVGSLIALLATGITIAVAMPEKKVDLANGASAFYEDGATEADARRVGSYLVEKKFLAEGTSVRIAAPRKRGAKVLFAVQDGSWNKPDVVAAFQLIADGLATDIYVGKNISVVLTNDFGLEKKTLEGHVLPEK